MIGTVIAMRQPRGPIAAETDAMQSREIVARLDNWGACLRLYVPGWSAPAPMGGELSSAEARWRSGFRSIGANPVHCLDVHDAKAIESAVAILPLYQHTILKAWYVRKLAPSSCLACAARVSGRKRMPYGAFDAELEMAHALLVEAMAVPAAIRKVRAQDLVREALALDQISA